MPDNEQNVLLAGAADGGSRLARENPLTPKLAWRRLAGFAALSLWAASLFAPAWHLESGGGVWLGWEFLLFGPIGLLYGHFGWLVNPLTLWLSCRLAAGRRAGHGSALLALICVGAALSAFTVVSIPLDEEYSGKIVAYRPGFFVWMGSAFLSAAATLANWAKSKFEPWFIAFVTGDS